MKTLFNKEQTLYIRDFLKYNKLSEKEIQVALLTSVGLSNSEIAIELSVTDKTVKFHLTNVFKKLGIKGRAKMIVLVFSQVLRNTELKLVQESIQGVDGSDMKLEETGLSSNEEDTDLYLEEDDRLASLFTWE